MDKIEIKTLIDITNTGVIRLNQGTQQQIDQNKNFTILKQCAEIRSIISYDEPPIIETMDIKGLGFGTNFKGKHRVWTFKFSPDRTNVYMDDRGDVLGLLRVDLDQIPVLKNLTETINIDKAIFDLADPALKNTVLKFL